MEPLLQSPAIEESMRRIQEVLGTAAAAAFPNAALRAITDHVTAQQSPGAGNADPGDHGQQRNRHRGRWGSRTNWEFIGARRCDNRRPAGPQTDSGRSDGGET